MGPKLNILVEGEALDSSRIQSELGKLGAVEQQDQTKSVFAAAAAGLAFIVKFAGPAADLADKLISLVTKRNLGTGARVKIQIQGTIVEVDNVHRSQIIALLEKAAEIHKASGSL